MITALNLIVERCSCGQCKSEGNCDIGKEREGVFGGTHGFVWRTRECALE